MPLALLELPLFVLIPSLYGQGLGLSLAVIGAVLFGARLIDAFADPLIGAVMDRSAARLSPRRSIAWSAPLMVGGFWALLNPPDGSSEALAAWLALGSLLAYLGWSIASIAHQAWGAGLAGDDRGRVRVTGVREACGLAGVLLSAALLDPSRTEALLLLFAGCLALALAALSRAPTPWIAHVDTAQAVQPIPSAATLFTQMALPVTSDPRMRRLLAVFMVNGTATAIPATLVLFFIADVLEAPGAAPGYLLLYFAAGALGMPIWMAAGARLGLARSWLLGMAASVLAFVWAFGLGPGDTAAFAVICALSGLALGADLALPSALLARLITMAGRSGRDEGAYFGLWNLATKLNLAIAAGVGLAALELLGYQPGLGGSTTPLSLSYAVLPCVLKLVAVWLLWRASRLFQPPGDNPP